MPTVNFDKTEFISLLGKTVDDKTLSDRISMIGTDLEKVNPEIVVEVFPDRPDMLSIEGFTNALKGFMGIEKGPIEFKVHKSNYEGTVDPKVKSVRPFAVGAIVKGINFDDNTIRSLMQIQEKLHITHGRNRKKVAIGVHDLDTIKFPIRYTTMPRNFSFIPLEFDKNLTINEILKVHPKGIAYAHLLDDFKECPIWIDSNDNVLSMPPIINGDITKVTGKTKNLFIDITGTHRKSIEYALNIILMGLFIRGGEIYSFRLTDEGKDWNYPDFNSEKIELDIPYSNKILGLNLSENETAELLMKMRYGISSKSKDKLIVEIPPYRADILHPIDLVEDISISYGFENFTPEIPDIATIGQENPIEIFLRKIEEVMIGFNFFEVKNYILSNEDVLITKMLDNKRKLVKTRNAVNTEFDTVRCSLLPLLIKTLASNSHYEYPQNLFELGVVVPDQNLLEKQHLSCAICHPKANFSEIKGIFNGLLSSFGLMYSVKEEEYPYFIQGRSCSLEIDGVYIGKMGELNPEVLYNFNLEMPVSAFEIDLSIIFELFKEKI
ncbi:MAG: Phenylalanine--tRNA ligase beta subunit [Candidatus Methanofastidiosum methylothiophilum]|uniref:Phenylalanine--tRNA ligase beta subunit n=1 Tax=Candidatus Methanofastidiosum methylothiophilum TaxID=1705564 RepID=A0A150IHZ0_9EURY|nr:MAG: Phenylalanine--tRNA ligase beta subunit [Candidatus Methanofastidiosum methylthiophilus]KYC48654.1 MAG: Phenylalanine--tRNA ligase beta subunit [Candidatus Methanofastidiosum methylthiophilus]KYC51141.1 MAG: Phenylalanine--tRNA ligase beta subunit [Candidatus Methanofastidiosum methylthiophilus]